MMTFSRPNPIRFPLLALAAAVASALCQTSAAQVSATAIGPGHTLWAGADYINYNASFPYQSNQRLSGYQFFANYNFTPSAAVEADVRLRNQGSFYGETESSYLMGPQYRSRRFGRAQFYAQILAGMGRIQFPFDIGYGNYFAASPGFGINYRLTRHLQIRAGYDVELWFNSPNVANEPEDPITPSGFHAGLAFNPSGRRR
jgi:hypothetical protein